MTSAGRRRIAVTGASGRMGRMLVERIEASDDLVLAAALDLGDDVAGRLAESKADVLIDFTRPAGTLQHLQACRAQKVAAVVGTTGFSPAERAEIGSLARDVAIVLAPNMSVGVNVAMALVEQAARALDDAYDIEIVEMHHRLKVDAPSGTALQLGERAARGRGVALDDVAVHARHGETGERRRGTIGFAALRGGDVVGDHTVVFAGSGERIEITHRSTSRVGYAEGALQAARFLAGRPSGLYDMADVLGFAKGAAA